MTVMHRIHADKFLTCQIYNITLH